MVIDWTKFLPALALLLTPIALFHGKKVRFMSVSRDWDGRKRQILALGLHTIDLGRAALGGWLLILSLAPDPTAHGLMRQAVLLTQGATLCVAVLLQTFFCKEPESAHAPFAFVTGLVFGLYAPAIAGLPLLFAIVIASGSRTPSAFFPTLSIALLAIGILLGGKAMIPKLVIGACAVLLPWLCSLLFSLDLVTTYRAKRPSGSHR